MDLLRAALAWAGPFLDAGAWLVARRGRVTVWVATGLTMGPLGALAVLTGLLLVTRPGSADFWLTLTALALLLVTTIGPILVLAYVAIIHYFPIISGAPIATAEKAGV